MDIYISFDMIIVALALLVHVNIKRRESLLLLLFFTTSSVTSFIMDGGLYFSYWPVVFTFICLVFGLLSNKLPIVLGYALFLSLLGVHQVVDVILYSEYVCLIFAYQLWIVIYEGVGGYRVDNVSGSNASKTRNKGMV